MSEESLVALLARIKEDPALAQKIKEAPDLLAAQAIAVEAGFDVTEEDWTKYTEENPLSDEDLEGIAGGLEGICQNSSCAKGNGNKG
jgi:predicted ribosomally synthesized peptide with nif11-like leader